MSFPFTRILVTGSQGFVGRNLMVRLGEEADVVVARFDRGDDSARLENLLAEADVVIHLAGENRPKDERAFDEINAGLTVKLCDAIQREFDTSGRHVALLLASSIQAECDTPYGRSKLAAEQAVRALAQETKNPAIVFRLPGVFGKWGRPNYNSVVATFCHNIARGLPIRIDDPDASLRLAYIDDVLNAFLSALKSPEPGFYFADVDPTYVTTVGELAALLQAFETSRAKLRTERVGTGLVRALYATYLSYLPEDRFAYDIPQHGDERGVFVEMLKTPDCGQFSYFTANPGVTRGGHYHHTKSEKFLVIKGEALFRFRHILSGEKLEIRTSNDKPRVVETIPGWSHDITNIGEGELVVMLWANEVFDRQHPDTIASKV
ncbi:capsular biosynthesis protein [Thioclava sp. DLFJ5-1]|uniref:UDP-2-acetamido-2,6-beta-L-arabino-hexul-4-ose reductase n=1 Tax=Thioclava sp. DLFJ5-1 TaxID=1915314 RepID=UPI0009988C75|nr:NAD-dependent epimerase/dehydratase family protein [Thioclava sp. DLFJ5-1]OOY22036.1 capsular biosynthesis protein [Thioclava sp. DLFJ5-1]